MPQRLMIQILKFGVMMLRIGVLVPLITDVLGIDAQVGLETDTETRVGVDDTLGTDVLTDPPSPQA